MIHFIRDVPDDIIAISIDGKLTKKDYERFDQMVRLKDQSDKLKFYVELADWEGMSLAALIEDIKTGFKYYLNIEKMAVIGSEKWLKNWTKVGDLLSPGIATRYFDPAQKGEAIEWLT